MDHVDKDVLDALCTETIDLLDIEDKFRTITEGSTDAIFITDKKGNYVYVNQAAVNLLGYSKNKMVCMNIADISHPEQTKENIRDFQSIVKEGKLFKEYNLIRRDGSVIQVDLNATLLPNGFVYGSCRDINKCKQDEQRIRHLVQYLRAIRNINQMIITEKDRDTLIQKACNLLVETQGYHNAWIVLLDKDNKYLTSAEAGYGPAFDPMRIQLKNGN